MPDPTGQEEVLFCFGIVFRIFLGGTITSLIHLPRKRPFLLPTGIPLPRKPILLSLILSGSELLFQRLLIKANKPNKTSELLEDTKLVLRLFFSVLYRTSPWDWLSMLFGPPS